MKIGKMIRNGVYGAVIGICMLIPGVSGGTIAVLLGIYDDLLSAMAALFSEFKNSIVFLTSVGMGGLFGAAIMSRLIGFLLNQAPFFTTYFFMGIILGGIGMMKSGRQEREKVDVLMLIFGVVIVCSLRFLPVDVFDNVEDTLWIRFVIMLVMGVLLGAALILPGISFSMTLVFLGIYEEFMRAVAEFDLRYLLPIIFSTLFGIIVLSKALSRFIRKCPGKCHSMIMGFVIASLVELFPGFPPVQSALFSIISLLLGFLISLLAVYFIKRKRA